MCLDVVWRFVVVDVIVVIVVDYRFALNVDFLYIIHNNRSEIITY